MVRPMSMLVLPQFITRRARQLFGFILLYGKVIGATWVDQTIFEGPLRISTQYAEAAGTRQRPYGLHDRRSLQSSIANVTCVEESDISSYCCGTEAKDACIADGATYTGPEEPCEVVVVVISESGELFTCTGIDFSSDTMPSCPCADGSFTPAPVSPTSSPVSPPTTAPNTMASSEAPQTGSPRGTRTTEPTVMGTSDPSASAAPTTTAPNAADRLAGTPVPSSVDATPMPSGINGSSNAEDNESNAGFRRPASSAAVGGALAAFLFCVSLLEAHRRWDDPPAVGYRQ